LAPNFKIRPPYFECFGAGTDDTSRRAGSESKKYSTASTSLVTGIGSVCPQ